MISFKDCRATLKHNKWNFRAAYIKLNGGLNLPFDTENAAEFVNAIIKAADELSKAFRDISKPINNAIKAFVEFKTTMPDVLAESNKENGGKI